MSVLEGLAYAYGGGMVVHYLNGDLENTTKYLTYSVICIILNSILTIVRNKND